MLRKEAFLEFKKYDVYVQSFLPDTPASQHIFYIHGLGEHSGSYEDFARSMTENKIACHGFDLIGHGKSSGQRGYIPRFGLFIEQADFVLSQLIETYSMDTVNVLAHSMGGLVALKKLTIQPFANQARLILSNPLTGIKVNVPQWKKTLAHNISHVIPRVALDNEIADTDLTSDEAILKTYSKDPWRHRKISAKLFSEIQITTQELSNYSGSIDLPTLLLLSPMDNVCDPSASQRFAKNFNQLTFDLYPQSKHEILNDLSRNRAKDSILNFIQETLSL